MFLFIYYLCIQLLAFNVVFNQFHSWALFNIKVIYFFDSTEVELVSFKFYCNCHIYQNFNVDVYYFIYPMLSLLAIKIKNQNHIYIQNSKFAWGLRSGSWFPNNKKKYIYIYIFRTEASACLTTAANLAALFAPQGPFYLFIYFCFFCVFSCFFHFRSLFFHCLWMLVCCILCSFFFVVFCCCWCKFTRNAVIIWTKCWFNDFIYDCLKWPMMFCLFNFFLIFSPFLIHWFSNCQAICCFAIYIIFISSYKFFSFCLF